MRHIAASLVWHTKVSFRTMTTCKCRRSGVRSRNTSCSRTPRSWHASGLLPSADRYCQETFVRTLCKRMFSRIGSAHEGLFPYGDNVQVSKKCRPFEKYILQPNTSAMAHRLGLLPLAHRCRPPSMLVSGERVCHVIRWRFLVLVLYVCEFHGILFCMCVIVQVISFCLLSASTIR